MKVKAAEYTTSRDKKKQWLFFVLFRILFIYVNNTHR